MVRKITGFGIGFWEIYRYNTDKGGKNMNSSVIANMVKNSSQFQKIRIVGEHGHGHWHSAHLN